MIVTSKKPTLQKYKNVATRDLPTLFTGNAKIDNFASSRGGFVIGSCIFFTGTSGAGKTTFAILLQKMFSHLTTALYSREMESCDVKDQTQRLGLDHENALIADKSDCDNIDEFIEAIDHEKPKVVIIDSLQVIMKEDCVGGKTEEELWNLISKLRTWVSNNNAVLFIIGHVNKDGTFEGPNTIKQMFDAHMHMDFNEKTKERVLSWTKNRKGDESVRLFYIFTKDDMVFFTEDEWKARSGEKNILDIVDVVLQGFIESLNHNHPSYEDFCEDFEKEMRMLSKGFDDDEITSQSIIVVHRLTVKHGLVVC